MAQEHPSGLPHAYDGTPSGSSHQGVVFYGRRPFVQGRELNALQTIERQRLTRLGKLIAKDGNRVVDARAIVDREAGTVKLTAGEIYVSGDVHPVAAAELEGVPMEGRTTIGVRKVTTWLTHEDEPGLLGLVAGAPSEGEEGAAREVVAIAWALEGDDGEGEYYPVYTLQDGTILDETPPPALDGIREVIRDYDRPNGNYVVEGCQVVALGKVGEAQVFSIAAGEANIDGLKVTRFSALRVAEPEDWDAAAIPGETHTYPGGASHTFAVDRAPIDEISQILLTKQKTQSITRGVMAGGADALPDTSVIEIVSIPGYTQGVDYIRTGNTVDWAPGGAEPAGGASYNVTYRYRASVDPDAFTDSTITVSGGAADGDIIVSYTQKLPRVDRLCIDPFGAPVYVKGVSAAQNAFPPPIGRGLLWLAEIRNDWMSTPQVRNTRVIFVPQEEHWRLRDAVADLTRLVTLERIRSGIDQRDPSARRDMFVDPLIDDSLRDAGVAQTAAVGDGMIQLPITVTVHFGDLAGPVMLDHVEEVVVAQKLKTGCVRINEYQNFTPLPGALSLSPASDFWTEPGDPEFTSPVTLEFQRGVAQPGSPLTTRSTETEIVARRREEAEFLRPIEIEFTLRGFGAGEELETLTFGGIDVKPVGTLVADANGEIVDSFEIPENVPAGTVRVFAEGAGGTWAQALFTGAGTITIETMRRVTTINRWSAPPVVVVRTAAPPSAPTVWQPWQPPTIGGGGSDAPGAAAAGVDPQAQIIALDATRQLVGVDFHLCHIGDPANAVLIHQVATDNGDPTPDPLAEAFVPMSDAALGWIEARYAMPVTTPAGRRYAFVVKTDDAEHSISYAGLGGFDETLQQFVTVHPYTVGPRLSAVNAAGPWESHQAEALTFRLVAARYPVTTKIVDLGEIALVNCSDLQVRAAVDLPSADCSVVFEIERANGTIWRLLPGQALPLNEYITETVEFRAVLTGTETLSPILYAPVEVLSGSIASSATYVSRAFALGEDVDLTAYMYACLPGGSTLTVQHDAADNSWQTMALVEGETEQLAFPLWTDRVYRRSDFTAVQGRLKITLTGGPAARPIVGNLGAAKRATP